MDKKAEIIRLVNNDLDLLKYNLEISEETYIDDDAFKQKLTQVIAYLLAHDFERLLQAMYRIDVQEQAFAHALQEGAESIAELVIQRELKKIAFREKYKKM